MAAFSTQAKAASKHPTVREESTSQLSHESVPPTQTPPFHCLGFRFFYCTPRAEACKKRSPSEATSRNIRMPSSRGARLGLNQPTLLAAHTVRRGLLTGPDPRGARPVTTNLNPEGRPSQTASPTALRHRRAEAAAGPGCLAHGEG